jgi:hypothetical protein
MVPSLLPPFLNYQANKKVRKFVTNLSDKIEVYNVEFSEFNFNF